jgi:predicted phage baseplate assembly protein
VTINVPVLDDRSFDQLVSEAMARIAVHTPEWTNLNASDPGVTIVDLFAFLTENLLYRSNRIPEANRLKFLSMLGISLEPPSPGIGLVTVTNDKGPLSPPLALAGGAEVRAGQVRFQTRTPLAVLPVTAAVYYKKPQTTLDAATQAQYQLIYQTFLQTSTDVLTFYQPTGLDPPATGKPDTVIDLGDAVNGTIDRSLWIALLAQGVDLDSVRRAIAGQTLSIGIYPATQGGAMVLPPATAGAAQADPGLVFEIAAPDPDPTQLAGPGFGIGSAKYDRLPITYADPVLQAPGIVQVTLPKYEKLMVWAFDPEEEGTGDFPPRVDDATIAARIVTWIRLRLPPLTDTTTPDTATTDPAAAQPAGPAGSTAAQSADAGNGNPCGCGCSQGTGSASVPAGGSLPAGGSVSTSTALALAAANAQPTGKLTWVGVNAVQIIQAIPVVAEQVGTGTGTPFQTFTLANRPVLTDEAPGGFTVTVQSLDGTRQAWNPIDDIYAARPDDQVYLLDPASGQLTFGSGLQGARVPLGATVLVSYSYGGGPQGQAAIGAVNGSVALPGGFSVSNPVPTWGASNGESTADGEAVITRWLRHRDRLVTQEDFKDLTQRTPAIDLGRVEVLPLFNPDQPGTAQSWPGMVTLMVIPRSDPLHPNAPVPDLTFLNAICAWLDPRRLVTTELHVRGPVYQPIWVSVGFEALPGQVPSIVRQQVIAAVQAFLSPLTGGLPAATPDGLDSGPAVTGTGWPLGIAVRSQDIEAVATRVPGVRYVDSVLIAAADPASGTVVAPVDPVPITGLQLPAATVFANTGHPDDPAVIIGSSQPVPPTQVPVPVVPPTC